jgi:Putative DNA-binding domain
MSDLKAMQCWFQSVVMHPHGPLSDEAEVERLLTPSRRLTAAERLAIYHNAYHVRLLECLREEFPILRQALGDETFDAFAYGYLRTYPSRSYTLIQLGTRFAQFLAETCPDDAPAEWSAFLIDLATLEWTFSEVFDGPGVEGEPLFDAAALAALSAEQWLQTRLTPVPCLRLLRLRSPVQEYYAAVRNGEEATPPAVQETFLAVTRRDYVVRHHTLHPAEFALLHALTVGRTVGEAIEETAALLPDTQAAALLHGWFQRWAANGFFQPLAA